VKTAVSLPDKLFHQAERTAKRLHVSRSELYAQALADFLARNDSEAITAQLNAVYSKEESRLDPAFERAQLELLKQSQW
jgi:metal-responsive CopG/Arc/MetJ family transcriptional regulator